jgi:hypothetical protein
MDQRLRPCLSIGLPPFPASLSCRDCGINVQDPPGGYHIHGGSKGLPPFNPPSSSTNPLPVLLDLLSGSQQIHRLRKIESVAILPS